MKNFALASTILINGQPTLDEVEQVSLNLSPKVALEQAYCRVNGNTLVEFRTANNPTKLESVCLPNNRQINPNNGQPQWTGIETPKNTIFYRIRKGVNVNEPVCAYLHRRSELNPDGKIKGERIPPVSSNGAFLRYNSPYSGVFTVESRTFTGNQAPQFTGNPSISIGTGRQCN
jgi:hypothetical protein